MLGGEGLLGGEAGGGEAGGVDEGVVEGVVVVGLGVGLYGAAVGDATVVIIVVDALTAVVDLLSAGVS